MKFVANIPTPRRSGAFTFLPVLIFCSITVISFWATTEWTAAQLGFQVRLGAGWFSVAQLTIYPPWAIFVWEYGYSSYAPTLFLQAFALLVAGPLVATACVFAFAVRQARKTRVATTHGSARWATETEYTAAGLLDGEGAVLGTLPDGRLLRYGGPEHIACIAPTRSGKGIGQVIPTLLTWPGSVLVHDMKGENWAVTSAWRATFSNVIYFNPTDASASAHFNPLLEVRRDENQVRDVQNIADQLVDPHGKGKESHWDRTADQFFLGAILHVLHAEADKSLYGLAQFLSDPERSFEDTLLYMKGHPHDRGFAHVRIASAAQAMLNKSEEERSGVLSTALGHLGLYADPIVARNTADSDFRILDLMQAEHPVSLYIVVPDSDRLRLKPLTRLVMTMITQRLVEVLNPKERKHPLLMLIDEFPRLGKLPFFTDAITHLAGYNIKVMLVMQSKSQLDAPESHGRGNTIVETCKVKTLYTPQDPDTAQWISEALGPKTEVHQQTTYTGHRLAFWLGHVMVADQESARPLLDAAEVGKLPPAEQIVLVAGYPPFKALRLKYFERPEFAQRADLPPLPLPDKRPYPYRPAQKPNPWLTQGPVNNMVQTGTSAGDAQTFSPVASDLETLPPRAEVDPALGVTYQEDASALEQHGQALELEVLQQQQALDEMERLDRARSRSPRHSISH